MTFKIRLINLPCHWYTHLLAIEYLVHVPIFSATYQKVMDFATAFLRCSEKNKKGQISGVFFISHVYEIDITTFIESVSVRDKSS